MDSSEPISQQVGGSFSLFQSVSYVHSEDDTNTFLLSAEEALRAPVLKADGVHGLECVLELDGVIRECLTQPLLNDWQLLKGFQTLMKIVVLDDSLAVELYWQLFRQLNGNPNFGQKEGALRLMAMTCKTLPFPPEAVYVLYSEITLLQREGMPEYLHEIMLGIQDALLNTTSEHIPHEISLHVERFCSENIEVCRVMLPDRKHDDIVYDSRMLVSEGVSQLMRRYSIPSDHEFELFLSINHGEYPLEKNQTMMEAMQCCHASSGEGFLKLKRAFRATGTEPSDSMSVIWTYFQLKAEYHEGRYPVSENIAAELCALQFRSKNTRLLKTTSEKGISKKLERQLPLWCTSDESERSESYNAAWLEARRIPFHTARQRFIQKIGELSYGHSHFISARVDRSSTKCLPLDIPVWIGINSRGIHILRTDPCVHLLSVSIEQYCTCQLTEETLQLKLDNSGDVQLHIGDSEMISALLKMHGYELKRSILTCPTKTEEHVRTETVSDAPVATDSCDTSHPKKTEDTEEKNTWEEKDIDEASSEESENLFKTATTKREDSETVEVESDDVDPSQSTDGDGFMKPLAFSTGHLVFDLAKKSLEQSQSGGSSLEKKLRLLTAGTKFKDYRIDETVKGEPLMKYATDLISNAKVLLKFYSENALFDNLVHINKLLQNCGRVCKILGFLRSTDGYPSCAIFERGTKTLEQYLIDPSGAAENNVSILKEISLALEDVHKYNVIHCYLQPSLIVHFQKDDIWKLGGFEYASLEGQRVHVQKDISLKYTSPEMIVSETVIAKEKIDRWSIGVIGYELLSGRKFYDDKETKEHIKECIRTDFSHISMNAITDVAGRNSVRKLLDLHGRMCSPDFIQTGSISESRRIECGEKFVDPINLSRAEKELVMMNTTAQIEVEEFKDRNVDLHFSERETSLGLYERDDRCSKGISVLNIGREYRLRIGLRHNNQDNRVLGRIVGVALVSPEKIEMELEVAESISENSSLEVLAHYDPLRLQRPVPSLNRVGVRFGPIREKFVNLDVKVRLSTGLEKKDNVFWKMAAADDALFCTRLKCRWVRFWNHSPQSVRDGVKSIRFVVPAAASMASGAALGNPCFACGALGALRAMLTLGCCQAASEMETN